MGIFKRNKQTGSRLCVQCRRPILILDIENGNFCSPACMNEYFRLHGLWSRSREEQNFFDGEPF